MDLNQAKERLPKNTSLPDLDDASMSFVFEFIEYYHNDLFWSFLSDSCFLLGSILYLCLSYYDFFEKEPSFYIILDFAAPLLFLANSAVDVHWANQVQQRLQVKKAMKQSFEQTILSPQTSDEEEETPTPVWYRRIRKHAGHRKSLYAAATFGIAAFLAVVAVLLNYIQQEHMLSTTVFDIASAHVYILSAVIAVTGRRTRPFFTANEKQRYCSIVREPEALEDIGDFLFLVGSLLDALLEDVHQMDHIVICGAIISSILWLVDALFYLQSDFVMARRMNAKLKLDEGDPSAVLV